VASRVHGSVYISFRFEENEMDEACSTYRIVIYWRPTAQQMVFDTNKTMLVLYYLLARWFAEPISSILKMEAISSSETSVETQRTTRRHIPEDDTLHITICLNTNRMQNIKIRIEQTRNACRVFVARNLEEREHLVDLGIDGIILKLGFRVCTLLI
jgi:hypothetical protein